jgi:lactoylglutathione lyase
MHIEHIALWTNKLVIMKEFYEQYFGAQSGSKYHNPTTQLMSYFLTFSSGARLELISMPNILDGEQKDGEGFPGYVHMVFSTGSEEAVNALTKTIEEDGYQVLDGPRHTGDGYYESVIVDPDGNRVEITV